MKLTCRLINLPCGEAKRDQNGKFKGYGGLWNPNKHWNRTHTDRARWNSRAVSMLPDPATLLRFAGEHGDPNGTGKGGEDWHAGMIAWELRLHGERFAFTFPYYCGLAHVSAKPVNSTLHDDSWLLMPEAPDLAGVLENLLSDAAAEAQGLLTRHGK